MMARSGIQDASFVLFGTCQVDVPAFSVCNLGAILSQFSQDAYITKKD